MADATFSIDYAVFIPQLIYAIVGAFGVFGNALIIAAILKEKRMRKKRILLVALAMGDGLNALGSHVAGISRIVYLFMGMLAVMVSPIDCLRRIWNPIWIVGEMSGATFNFLVSIDRFCAVAAPMKYFVTPKTQITLIIAIVAYLFIFVAMSSSFVASVNLGPALTATYQCSTTASVGPFYGAFQRGYCIVTGSLALIIYGFTIANYRRQKMKLNEDSCAARHLQHEMKLVKVMALVVVLDFVLFIIPMIAYLILGVINKSTFTALITPFFGTLSVLHTVVNVIVYGTQDVDMRHAYRALWPGCKHDLKLLRQRKICDQAVPVRRQSTHFTNIPVRQPTPVHGANRSSSTKIEK